MARYIVGLKNSNFIPIVFVLLCVAVFGTGILSSGVRSNSQEDRLPQVKNETESFQLVSIEKNKDLITLRMKNASDRGITAYSVSSHGRSRADTDYSISGHVIAPGEIEEIEIPFSSLNTSGAFTGKGPEIRILTVVFDDHTSEGDFTAAADIRNTRIGKKIQLKRINRLMEEALKSSDADSLNTLNNLKLRIATLPENIEKGQPFAVGSGLRNAKEDILTLIDRIEERQKDSNAKPQVYGNNNTDLRGELTKLLREGEKWIAKY